MDTSLLKEEHCRFLHFKHLNILVKVSYILKCSRAKHFFPPMINYCVFPTKQGPRNLQTSATTVTEQTGQSNNFNLDHDYVCMKIVRTYVSMKSDQLNCHEHAFELVKKIISTYVVLRLKHHMKEENERIKKKRIRSRLSKLIIFKGQ